MSSHTTIFPNTNPICFTLTDMNGVRKSYEEYVDSWGEEQWRCFTQKFAEGDRISFQFSWKGLNVTSQSTILIECYRNNVVVNTETANLSTGLTYGSANFGFKQVLVDGKYNGVCWVSKKLSSLVSGIGNGDTFKFVVKLGWNPNLQWVSNVCKCISDLSRTKLIHYSNICASEQSVFDTYFGMMPRGYDLRLPAFFSDITSNSEKSVFMGYDGSVELVSAMPYESVRLNIGGDGIGIPRYMQRLLNVLFCLDEKYIDGIRYEVTTDGKLEKGSVQGYANDQWAIMLQRKRNTFGLEHVGNNAFSITITATQVVGNRIEGNLLVDATDSWYIESDSNAIMDVNSGGSGTKVVRFEMPVNTTQTDVQYTFILKSAQSGQNVANTGGTNKAIAKRYLNYMKLGDNFLLK